MARIAIDSTEMTLAQNAEAIRTLGRRTVEGVIEIGRRLTESKKLCGRGNWLPWLEREFGWSRQTADNFINVYEANGKVPNFGNLLSLPLSSLYLLAAPSTPEAVCTEITGRVAAGEKVTAADVQSSIEAAKWEDSVSWVADRKLQLACDEIANGAVKAAADRAEQTSSQRLAISRLPETEQFDAVPTQAAINDEEVPLEELETLTIRRFHPTALADISNDKRVELMTQLAQVNVWLNETAIEIAISGGANLGKLAPPSLRYEALSFMRNATARIEAELADRDVRESAS